MSTNLCVVLAVYRPDPGYLSRQIASIAGQTRRPDLLLAVIADLTSADLTRALCQEHGLPHRIEMPSGQLDSVQAFEHGLRAALDAAPEAAFFALCDQDDVWHPDRLAEGLRALQDQGVLLAHSDARVIDATGAVIQPSLFRLERRLRHPGLRGLLYRNTVTGMTVTMRRSLVELALPFPRQSGVHFYHDLWLALLAEAQGGLHLIDRPLVDYRQHGGNAIGAVDRLTASRPASRRWLPDVAWIRREAAGHALARYLALSLWHRLSHLPEADRPSLSSPRLRPLRRYMRRLRGTGAHLADALRYAVTGHRGIARLALGSAIVAAGRSAWSLRLALGDGLTQATRTFDDRLFSLAPGVQPDGREQEAQAAALPKSVEALVDQRKTARFTPEFTAPAPAVTILVPTLNPPEVFAGIATAVDLGLILAGEGVPVRFIATDLPIGSHPVSRQFLTARLTPEQQAAGAAGRITLHCGVTEPLIPAHRADRFVATAWWTAHVARSLIEGHGYLWHRFLYLIQDYEPGFYPWGAEYADALSSYALDFMPLFNTTLLRDHFAAQGFAFAAGDAPAFRPAIDIDRHVRTERPARAASAPRRIAVYGRPEVARNLFPTAVEALDLFLATNGIPPNAVQLDSVGLRHPPVTLRGGHVLTSRGKLPWHEYPGYLATVDIGLSLMLSPHPSHPPIEMAAAGARVVTNGFGAKDLSRLSLAILSAPPDPRALAAALTRAWTEPLPGPQDRRIDLSSLGQPLDVAVRALAPRLLPAPAILAPGQPRRVILHLGAPKCGSTFLQTVLLRNRDRLARQGIAYPHDGGIHPGNASDLGEIDAARLARDFGNARTLIYSHEGLLALAARHTAFADLARAEGVQVQLLTFLRPFSEMIFGTISQMLKQDFEVWLQSRDPYGGLTAEEFAARSLHLYQFDQFLRRWRTVFHEQEPNLPPILVASDRIVPTMTRLLDGAEIDWALPRNDTNPSLRLEDCERIAALIREGRLPDQAIRDELRAALHRTHLPDAGRSADRIAAIEAIFAACNATLLQDFGFDNSHAAHRPAAPAPAPAAPAPAA